MRLKKIPISILKFEYRQFKECLNILKKNKTQENLNRLFYDASIKKVVVTDGKFMRIWDIDYGNKSFFIYKDDLLKRASEMQIIEVTPIKKEKINYPLWQKYLPKENDMVEYKCMINRQLLSNILKILELETDNDVCYISFDDTHRMIFKDDKGKTVGIAMQLINHN